MRIFADKKTIKQILNSKTEAHSYPLCIVGERANKWQGPALGARS